MDLKVAHVFKVFQIYIFIVKFQSIISIRMDLIQFQDMEIIQTMKLPSIVIQIQV